uniref:Reelin domain-containing protein n=1 Tax=Esox lucius TaxID=8010 RepID=A0A6Q2ZF55_ESOLU
MLVFAWGGSSSSISMWSSSKGWGQCQLVLLRSTCIHHRSVEQQRPKTKVTMCISAAVPLWVGVAFSLILPTLGFSRGASPASCLEMSPGHVRTHPQNPHRSHVTLYTSASSYLPGDLVTVTVRSTRDFMGFLLQARSLGVAGGRGRGAGGRVAGAWTLTPPGTHTLDCFGNHDSLTHSDKQLKRNLSFVWRAPDTTVGDIRFYITVVQSYFVYWARVESAVLHDGSRSLPGWGNASEVVGGSGSSKLQKKETILTSPAAPGLHPRLLLGGEPPNYPHPEPSPVPRRSHSDPLTPHSPSGSPPPMFNPVPQNHSLGPQPNLKTKRQPRTPEREAKIPNTVPTQSAWELGVLLVCAACLGTVLAGGFRFVCGQYCKKHTGVTLNDRERDYDRDRDHGEGMIHVQECGDLVRVRRIRENSFLLLAEYNLLPPPGN